ncbi:helix-turn-helix domain-containing protein [Actinomadura rupiterrae]|uniref:helix-turn-helix domain-containing protein n=1 Tax=Actinomadura rupiterrae TaxID=559627 RepID=UPI0020A61055|nr:helix-turn-helix transcriptional regulator [Actinomadura rupiterrae]MCP2336757.1 transcriptional regulator with XRE-family HTH domain [Actinomadura rupiterrae]
MTQPGLVAHPLTYVREQRGWTQAHVASVVAQGRNMATWKQKVNRWERRGVRPEPSAQRALAEALGVPPRLVDAHPWPEWLLYADDSPVSAAWSAEHARSTLAGTVSALTDRRGFLTLSGAAIGVIAAGWTEPWRLVPQEKVARSLRGGRTDHELVSAIEKRLADLWTLDDLVGGEITARLAVNDLELVTGLLTGSSYTLDVERRLFKVAGGLCRQAGWGAFDAGRPAAAERYWHAGLRAAKEARDVDGGVYILSNMAMQRFYAGDGAAAVELLEASRGSRGRLSRTVLAMLDTWQVRAYAKLGDRVLAGRALARAEAHWERRDPEDDPAWIYWMQRPSTTIEPNLAMLELGQPAEVPRNLAHWVDLDRGEYPRDHALALTVVATAQIQMGQVDAAVATGRRALALLRSVDSGRVGDELYLMLDRLPDDRVSGEFREEVAEETRSG